MKKRNLIAKELWSPKYRKKIIANKKGKGSYNRKKIKLENKNSSFSFI